MQRLLNALRELFGATGRAGLAGFGATVDTAKRLTWIYVLTILVSIATAVLIQSSWWLAIIAIVAMIFMVGISFTLKGLWTIGFIGGVDSVKQAVPESIQKLFPKLTFGGFFFLRSYFRAVVFLIVSQGALLLVYSMLPIWEAPKLIAIQLLAMLLYAMCTTSLTAKAFRAVCLVVILGTAGYFMTFWGQGSVNEYLKAGAAEGEMELSRSSSESRFNSEVTYGRVIFPSRLLKKNGDGYEYVEGLVIGTGTVVQFTDVKVRGITSPDHEPYVSIRLTDEYGNFTGKSRVGFFPRSKLVKMSPAEYQVFLQAVEGDKTNKGKNSQTPLAPSALIPTPLLGSTGESPVSFHRLSVGTAIVWTPLLLVAGACVILAVVRKSIWPLLGAALVIGAFWLVFASTFERVAQAYPHIVAGNMALLPATSIPPVGIRGVGANGLLGSARPDFATNLSFVDKEVAKYPGLSRDLVLALIREESNWDPLAVSPKSAKGLMQLLDSTAAAYGVTDPFDPAQNVRGGINFFYDLLREFKSWRLAIAAYNWGPENLRRPDLAGKPWDEIKSLVPEETRNLVAAVERRLQL